MIAYPAPSPSEIDRVADVVSSVLATAPFVAFAYGYGRFFDGLSHHDVDAAIR